MARLPRVTAAEVIRVLGRAGFSEVRQRGAHKVRQRGAHKIYRNAEHRRVTVSDHAGKILPPKTIKSILSQAGWSVEEFVQLVKD